VLIESEQHGASDYFVTLAKGWCITLVLQHALAKLGETFHNSVTGASAYVVVPASISQSR